MNELATVGGHTYGDVHALGSARVIVGDSNSNNIHIESAIFNVSCQCVHGVGTNLHRVVRGSYNALHSSPYGLTDGPDSDRNSSHIRNNAQDHSSTGCNRSLIKSCNSAGFTHNKSLKTKALPNMAASTILVNTTSETRRSRINDPITNPSIVPNVAIDGDRNYSKPCARPNNTVQQTSKARTNYIGGNKSSGNNYCGQMSIASTNDKMRAHETSVTFKSDLSRPYKAARDHSTHRLFFLRRNIPDWSQSTCTESLMSLSEIKDRVKFGGPTRYRHYMQNIERTLSKLDPRRKYITECLRQEVNRCDSQGLEWSIVAIDNENPKFTRRTGEVDIFSVILARSLDDVSPK